MRIENQTHAVPGQVRGPAPQRHQVREVTLRIESLPTGQLRVSTPAARGWAMVVSSQHELSRAVTSAFTEAQCAAYSRWRGERYDLDDLTEPMEGDPLAPPRPPARRRRNTGAVGWGRNQQRPDTHDADAWTKLPDGRWQSPKGKRWKPDTMMAQRVVARRVAAGLPV